LKNNILKDSFFLQNTKSKLTKIRTWQLIWLVFIILPLPIIAQKQPLINDKPGSFEILSRANYTLPNCGFTKAEMTANLQEITELINTFRKNTTLSDIRGFEGKARIYNTNNCRAIGEYGVPSRISFEFCTWYRSNEGKMKLATIEPPEWSLIINKINPEGPLFSTGGPNAKGHFNVPLQKVTIGPGIDEYDGECYVIYNPGRPPYWVSVTVKEYFDAFIDGIKNTEDKVARDFLLDLAQKEYAATSREELNKPAYNGGGQPISGISSNNQFPPIVRVNPEYWDKSLPKSAIQFIYFRMVNNKPYLESRTAEALKEDNSASYQLYRFEKSLDMNMVRSLVPLIGKK
jgi:hypothetical protein